MVAVQNLEGEIIPLVVSRKEEGHVLVRATPKQLIGFLKRSIKILFHSGIVTLTSPSKFLTGTIFLHAHLQAVYYNCVKFHLKPMSCLGGVALSSSTCTFTKRRRACTL
jgi:hypothetical protein